MRLPGVAPGDTARLYDRLSSYRHDPEIDWPLPIDHPLVRQDFAPNDRPTFPADRKVYRDSLPRSSCRRHGRSSALRRSTSSQGAPRTRCEATDLAGLIDGPDAARHRGPSREASNRRRTALHG